MTTQEMTKQEMIMNLREKREEKKKAKLKAKHRRCTIAIITLVAMMTVIFGTCIQRIGEGNHNYGNKRICGNK